MGLGVRVAKGSRWHMVSQSSTRQMENTHPNTGNGGQTSERSPNSTPDDQTDDPENGQACEHARRWSVITIGEKRKSRLRASREGKGAETVALIGDGVSWVGGKGTWLSSIRAIF